MKKLAWTCALITTAGLFSSCNDKLDIAAPYKNITVVYGLLDMKDTAHYVRIQKAFMDNSKSAIDMAKEADSSFYRSLEVSMKEISAAGVVLNTITMPRVDLANEGYPKDTGAFFNTPNYGFKLKYGLNPSNTYRLIIRNTETGNVDSAVSPVINTALPYTSFGVRSWISPGMTINFARSANPATTGRSSYGVTVPASVYMAQLVLRFNWTDTNTETHSAVNRFADYIIDQRTVNPSSTTDFYVTNQNVYDFIAKSLGTPGDNDLRYLDSCDMFVYAAGEEYEKYNRLNQNQGGLTTNEIRPVYTNIKGKDVMGLFSTRASVNRLQIPIDQITRDSIAVHPLTKSLKIRYR